MELSITVNRNVDFVTKCHGKLARMEKPLMMFLIEFSTIHIADVLAISSCVVRSSGLQ